jgi:ABC-2 type transport system ATP-binding protein
MKFGEFTAVDAISFEVAEGEVFGFLGPNGAGKTTLIRMLTTLLKPTSGEAWVAGREVAREPAAVRRSIGVVPQAMTSDLDLTGYENMDIYGRFYSLGRRELKERIAYLLDTVGLTERAGDLVAAYSGGMRRRLEIARALIHRPQVLFLDEPTIGLDPQSRRAVWDFLRKFREGDAMTILLSTHYMDEAEAFCERVAIIDSGRIIALGRPDDLKAEIPGNDSITLTLADRAGDLPDRIRTLPFVHSVALEDSSLRVYVDSGGQNLPVLLDEVKETGGKVSAVTIQEQSLEDVFIHFTGKSIREETRKVNLLIGAGIPQKWGR